MENIDNMGKNTLENLSAQNLSAGAKRKLAREIISALIALACLAAGWIYSLIFPGKPTVAALIYVVGIVVESAGIFAAAIPGVLTQEFDQCHGDSGGDCGAGLLF